MDLPGGIILDMDSYLVNEYLGKDNFRLMQGTLGGNGVLEILVKNKIVYAHVVSYECFSAELHYLAKGHFTQEEFKDRACEL